MINPDCTPGEVYGHDPGHVTAACGCGWVEAGLESRSAAKRAQRAHRFPPGVPEVPDPDPKFVYHESALEPRTPVASGAPLAVTFQAPR